MRNLEPCTEDSSRDVGCSYMMLYGVIKPTDNLVIIDDSIVRELP
jgi:amidophosphoribosyltransferase